VNLLIETLDALRRNSKWPSDIAWVQWETFYCSWIEFEAIASFEYDAGYGGNEISLSLKIVGADWWLERGEYDGSEWWEFKTLPTKPDMQRTPVKEDVMES
jgi:hypothetical protein